MTTPLPASSPSAEGVDAAGIGRFLDALESLPGTVPHGFVLLRHGRVVAEGWWAPFTPDRLHLLYSLSKTFTSTALGFAVAEGLVGLDDAIVDHFPEFEAEITGPRSRRIRVRDVLPMASGHLVDMINIAAGTDPHEPVRGFLLHEPESDPGSVFTYNQPATYSVATIVQKESGQRLVDYLRPRLLDPIGIGEIGWQQFPEGRDMGFSGLHATTRDVARLGQLYLDGGLWEGKRVLPEGWAEEVPRKRIETAPGETEPDWALGYGYQIWISRHGWRMDGAFGQFCLVLPEQDAVLAITEAAEPAGPVLEAVWEHLLPAFSDGPVDGSADAALADRLLHLEVPVRPGAEQPDADPQAWEGAYGPDAASDAPFVGVVLERADGAWTVTVDDGAQQARLPAARPGWTTVEASDGVAPIAVSGGWSGNVLALDLTFLETPHRIELEVRREDRRFRARWVPEPLGFLPDQRALGMAAPPVLG
ncbi:MAG TPA: serine hydrolase [Amnibacterium sp.]|nr:serine hydrolase [Amnibacterium sp.]